MKHYELSSSALGCTVYLARDTAELTATATWASYERVASEYDTGHSLPNGGHSAAWRVTRRGARTGQAEGERLRTRDA